MPDIKVFFFRGLSTKGGDDISFAWLNWGQMHTGLQEELSQYGISLIPITGMGARAFQDQANHSIEFIGQYPLWQNPENKFHFLCHSAGGLIAKLTLAQLAERGESHRVQSLVTIATPHSGSHLAEACLRSPEEHPWAVRLMRLVGYDVRVGFPFYQALSRDTLEKAFAEWKVSDTRLASIVCGGSPNQWSWPFRLLHHLPTLKDVPEPSDGLLEMESQTFGEVLGEFNLDHLCQLGVYNKPEFRRMCQRLAEFWQT